MSYSFEYVYVRVTGRFWALMLIRARAPEVRNNACSHLTKYLTKYSIPTGGPIGHTLGGQYVSATAVS